jgi:hypothetical protein
MKETLIHNDPNQVSLSESFAAPDLYKTDPYHGQKEIDWANTPDHVIEKLFEKARSGQRATFQGGSLMGLDSVPFCNDQSDPDSTPYVQRAIFYADKIIVYPEYLTDSTRPNPNPGKIENLTRGRFNGYISRSSGITIRKRLEAWIKSVYVNRDLQSGRSRPKHSHIGFLTLTLPDKQIHSDNEIKRKCLMPFLQQLKRVYGVEIYFWSAEPQESGNIHFHLLVDRWLDKDKVNDHWNIACDHLGYLGRYSARTGDFRPPSTNIRSCPPDMSLVKYVMKYVSKQPEIRLSCYPAGYKRNISSAVRSEWKYCKEQVGEGGVVVRRSVDNSRKVVSCSYWAKEEIKGGLSEAIAKGYEVLGDQIEVTGGRVLRCFERRPIEGRSWNMSKKLKSVEVHSQYCSKRVYDLLSVLRWDPSVRITQGDYHEVYHCNVFDKLMRLDPVLLSDYRSHYVSVYRQLYEASQAQQSETPTLDQDIDLPVKEPPKYHWKQLRIAI